MTTGALILGLTLVHGESSDTGLRFVDATSSSGIQVRNLCGARPGDKGWLMESMGAGSAWLDYTQAFASWRSLCVRIVR